MEKLLCSASAVVKQRGSQQSTGYKPIPLGVIHGVTSIKLQGKCITGQI